MIESLKKYWFLLVALSGGAVWIATINSKTFDSPEQKVAVVKAVESMPTEAHRAVELANEAHAIEIRQLRYEDSKRRDSINDLNLRRKDSLFFDKIDRQTVQIEQLKEEFKKIRNN